MINRNKQQSFTLIELLVVIVIIGILAGVIMISTSSSIDKANIAKSKMFKESITNNLAVNMVSRWKLDKIINTNQTPDAWGDNTGTLGDGITSTTYPTILSRSECVIGECMAFFGGNYINFGNNAQLDIIEKTIGLWIKTKNNSMGVIGQTGGSGQWLLTVRDNKFVWDTWATGPDMAGYTKINDDKWHYLVIVISDINDKTIFYLDGNLEKLDSGSVITPAASGNFFIGSCDMVAGSSWCSNHSLAGLNGYLDDIQIYNAALSSSQIKQNYIVGLNSMLINGNISKEGYNQRLFDLALK
jgi:prepilin-type N-terminal cleavage/methylation domain-containing protein